jgi:hypothetical protein
MNVIANTTIKQRRAQQNGWQKLMTFVRATFAHSREQQIQIVCTRGVVWVTVENDAHDYFVNGSETLRLSTNGRVVAEALGDADFRVESCTTCGESYV